MGDFHQQKKGLQTDITSTGLGNYRLSAVSSDTVDPKGVSALPKAIAQEDGEETFRFVGLIETYPDQGDIFQQQERQLQGDKETATDTTTQTFRSDFMMEDRQKKWHSSKTNDGS